MKRKGKFKVLVVIIIGIILLVIPITMQAKGEVSKNVLDKYVVIGDEMKKIPKEAINLVKKLL